MASDGGQPEAAAPGTPPRALRSRSRSEEGFMTPPRKKARRLSTPLAPRSDPPWRPQLWCPQEANQQRELQVGILSGPLCTVVAWLSWSVLELKTAIEKASSIPVVEQTLVVGTSELDDDEQLFKVLQAGGAHITLVRRHASQVQCLQSVAKLSIVDLLHGIDGKLVEELCADRLAALALVRKDGRLLERLPDAFRADRGVVLATLRRHPMGLMHAAQNLRDDPDVVRAAVNRNPYSLQYASESLKASSPFIGSLMHGEDHVERLLANPKEALQWARTVLSFASPALQKDRRLSDSAGLPPPQLGRGGNHAGLSTA